MDHKGCGQLMSVSGFPPILLVSWGKVPDWLLYLYASRFTTM